MTRRIDHDTNRRCRNHGHERTISSALAASLVGAALISGCTGSDATIGFGPNGPIPPASIASVGTSGAPPVSAASLDYGNGASPDYAAAPQAASPAPVTSVQRGPASSLPPPAAATQPPATSQSLPPVQAPLQPAGQTLGEAPLGQPPSASPTQMAAIDPSPDPGRTTGDVQFLPLIGVPQEKAELLARALSNNAASRGLNIRPAAEAKTKVRLKGYFSAFNDGSNTTLVYVWDVLDENDQRTHRIQGQETIPGAVDDPWSVVDEKALDAVAAKTMDGAADALRSVG